MVEVLPQASARSLAIKALFPRAQGSRSLTIQPAKQVSLIKARTGGLSNFS